MPTTRFDPPGFVDDLTDAQRKVWSDWVSTTIDASKDTEPPPRPQFFNALKKPPAADAVEKDISWTAFPRTIKISAPSDAIRWKRADASRDVQDEYCEWSVERDPATGKITRVMFTSEAPEYWILLARVNPSRVLDLYRKHVNPAVASADLFLNGKYDQRNRWNNSTSEGAMHLIQRNNTLGAEIELAAAATVLRKRDGQVLTDERELINCANYGAPERFSDPHIGAEVNALARQKADLTLANPVGLCIAGLSVTGWKTPDGSNPIDYWRVVRGTKEKTVRAEYAVPPDKGFGVGDITINGKPINFGSQIADFITIKLTGLATRIGTMDAQVQGCGDEFAGDALESPALDLESILADYAIPKSRS